MKPLRQDTVQINYRQPPWRAPVTVIPAIGVSPVSPRHDVVVPVPPSDTIGDAIRAKAIVYWEMNGDFIDQVNGYNLASAGSVTFTTGKVYTSAASFNGNADRLSISRASLPAALNPDSATAELSFAIWFKPYDIPSSVGQYHTLLWTGAFGFGGCECRVDSNGQVEWHIYNGGGHSMGVQEQLDATPSDALNRWNLFVMQSDYANSLLSIKVLPYNQTNTTPGWTYGIHPCNICDSGLFIGSNDENWTPNFDIGPILGIAGTFTSDEIDYLWAGGVGKALYS